MTPRRQRILLTCAVPALGYWGFVAFDSWNFQRIEGRELDRIQSVGPPIASQNSTVLADALIGRIEVRRVGLSAMVVEGTTTAALKRAADTFPARECRELRETWALPPTAIRSSGP